MDVADAVGVGVPVVRRHEAEPVAVEKALEVRGLHLRLEEFQRNLDPGAGAGFAPEALGLADLEAAAHHLRHHVPGLVKAGVLGLDVHVAVDLLKVRHADVARDLGPDELGLAAEEGITGRGHDRILVEADAAAALDKAEAGALAVQGGLPVGGLGGEAVGHGADVCEEVGLVQVRGREGHRVGARLQPDAQVCAEVFEPVAVMAEAADGVRHRGGGARGAGLAPVQGAAEVQGEDHHEGGVVQPGPALLREARGQLRAREAANLDAVQAHVREARLGARHAPAEVGAARKAQEQEDGEGDQDQEETLAEVGNSSAFTVHHLMWNVELWCASHD